MSKKTDSTKQSWTEEIEVAAGDLVGVVKQLIREGNVRRLIIRKPSDDIIMEIPLTAGVVGGAALIAFAPVLAALGAMAALLTDAKIQIVRTEEKGKS
jgi:hypothetical protein